MALSNSKPHLALAIITCSLLLLSKMKSSESVSFNYPNFWSDLSDITFQGHANSTTGTLQLTKTDYDGNAIRSSAGQALYSEPVQLRDSNTGNLASFYTTFSFLLKTTASNPADGFAFFIAPTDSQVKDAGGCLGLFNLATATDTSKNQVVAVEFDTWVNGEWQEPRYRHIGIDVNSIESVATKRWQDSDVFSGSIATAHISYDASSKILTVILTYPNGEDSVLSHVVDLSDVLPEQVRVGFSGATGQYETKYILSWYFSSTGSTSSTLQSKSSNCKIFNRRCVI